MIITATSSAPPTKRPNKDPMPSHRPTPEQYAAMISAAAAAGQPLPRHHVSINIELRILVRIQLISFSQFR